MSRALLALPLALLLLAAPAHAETAKQHAAAGRSAAKAHKWSKSLAEYQEAYRMEPNSDYLVGIGDAYAALGNKAEARKQYNAYLADPLALDTDGVKSKLAALDKKSDEFSLDLPATPTATAGNDLGLELSNDVSKPKKGKKGKKDTSADALSLDLPSSPSKPADNGLSLDLPSAPPPKKADPNDLPLDFPSPPASPPPSRVATAQPVKNVDAMSLDALSEPPPAKPVVATVVPPPAARQQPAQKQQVAVASPPPKPVAPVIAVAQPPPVAPVRRTAPPDAVAEVTAPRVVEHNNRVIAYCTAGLAVGALAVGGLYYSKASQNQSDLTSQVRPGAQQQALIEQQKTNKSLALAGIVTGVVLAGVTTAIFVF